MVSRATPASRNHTESVENTSMYGKPAAKPSSNSTRVEGLEYAASASRQVLRGMDWSLPLVAETKGAL